MSAPVTLSSIYVDPESGIQRDAARPVHLQNDTYGARYDWNTLFYDVYRAGDYAVFQGPPLLNFLDHIKKVAPFKGAFGWPFPRARHFDAHKRGEIWLKSDADHFALDCALGQLEIAVQPDMGDLFAGRRVITTLSQNNDLRWIADWVHFYVRHHGADGVLFYDNGSSAYSLEELQTTLDAAMADATGSDTNASAIEAGPAVAVSWPFPYGPQGGLAGAVNGVETDWDSDFCQAGSLHHARHRFLRRAKSVLNVDIDELVLSKSGQSIFAATEQSPAGFCKFPGQWIGTHTPRGVTRETCRHADFIYRDLPEDFSCPPKWCLIPGKADRLKDSWSVHNLFGAKANKSLSGDFSYRHMRGITNSWKEDRWAEDGVDVSALPRDDALEAAFSATGLGSILDKTVAVLP